MQSNRPSHCLQYTKLTCPFQIWQIADRENRGLLTPAGFGVVLRLIGHYQAGREPSEQLALQQGPLPKFEGGPPGGAIVPPPGPPPSQRAAPIQPQTSGSAPIRVPPLTPEKVVQYSQLFEKSGAQNGILPGEQAKNIFERAGLPNEVLGGIWNLADTEQRGALVMTEFIIAMHLLASYKAGVMRGLPVVLPAGLYEAAARRPPPRQMSGSSPSPISAIPRQFSGAGGRVSSPLGRSAYPPPPQAAQLTGQTSGSGNGDWAITPVDKQKFDQIYSTLDRSNKGFITGEEAVPFFSNSKLPEEALAQIWDLADINSQGRLTRDEFAVAMYLIRQQRGKEQGRGNLPATLPQNLVPPSMRNQTRAPAQPTAPDFEQPAAPTIPKSAADDLFGLDALSSPPPPAAQAQAPMSTGGSTGYGDPFGNKSPTPMTPTSPTQDLPQVSTNFKPFVPSSSFGRSLDHQTTGGSNTGAFSQQRSIQPQGTGADDLLGDANPEESSKLTNESAELANLSSQVGTLSKQMQDVQGQRTTTQNQVSAASSQKQQFESRLAQLRTLYEQELKDVNGLRERLSASINETQKLKGEIETIERSHQELISQKSQITAALQSDQQENASLKDRMRTVNVEIAQIKPQLEKLKLDARQQKGLVAINKKQLTTNEGERDKLKTETEVLAKSNEDNARAIAESSRAESPVAVSSPAPSVMSVNNPFFRRQGSTDGAVFSPFSQSSQSPAVAQTSDHTFDDVFGSSFSSNPVSKSAMPPTTFKSEGSASHEVPHSALNTALPVAAVAGVAGIAAAGVSSLDGSRVSSPAPFTAFGGNRDVSGASEPPAPPESRQISSSFLPFPQAGVESLSSSRQVSAPNSRFGDGLEDSTGAETPTNYSGATPTGSSAGGQQEHVSTIVPHDVADSSRSFADSTSSIPGAFPGDINSRIAATPTGSSIQSDRALGSNNNGPIDPFGFDKEAPKPAAKDAFDSAFESFGSSKPAVEKSSSPASVPNTSKVNQEFPPLQQMDDEDDSDSDDGGFEDDFTAGSGGHSRNASAAISQSAVVAAAAPAEGLLAPRPLGLQHSNSAFSTSVDPPTPNAMASPPTYESTTSPHDKTQAEADAYSGLLPTREDSTTIESPVQPVQQSFGGPSGFEAPSTSMSSTFPPPGIVTPAANTVTPTPPAKVPFDDDFDDEFSDLEDAKEGGEDDDFANISAHDRSITDFDPTFDSPAASKASIQTAQDNNGFGSSSGFGEFTSSPVRSTAAPATSTLAPAPSSPSKITNDSHDWDAIFSGLDAPTVVPSTTLGDEILPAPPLTQPTNGVSSAGIGSKSANSASTTGTASGRPVIGRALTEAGVHDDPILKELTEMGYARKDALSALEKYDYNLERVSQS